MLITPPNSEQRQHLYFFLFICILFYLSFQLMWPGGMSVDTYNTLRQWQTGNYNTMHPTIMAWIWKQMDTITLGNKGSLLLLHLLLFWSAIFTLGLISIKSGKQWPYIGALIWLIPPVLAMTSVLWKDTSTACSLILTCLILIYFQQNKRVPGKAITLLLIMLLFFGMASRHNAIFCMPPLIFWLVNVLHDGSKTVTRKLLITVMVCIVMVAGKTAFEKSLVTIAEQPAQEIMLSDLVALSKKLNLPLIPEYVYKDKNMDFPTFNKSERFGFNRYVSNDYGTDDPEKWAQLRKSYRYMLTHHTAEYLQYRWYAFKNVLNLYGNYWAFLWMGPNEDQDNKFHLLGKNYLKYAASGPLFYTYTWFLSNIILVLLALIGLLPSQLRNAILYMNISAIMYVPPYFFLLTTGEFRYFYWPMTVTVFSIALLLPAWDENRMKRKLARTRPNHL